MRAMALLPLSLSPSYLPLKKRGRGFGALCPARVVAFELFQPFKSVHTCVRR